MQESKKPQNRRWVFSKKEDLLVFGGSSIIAITIGFFINGFGDYFWMYVLHDQPHVYTTYFYTYGSDRFSKRFKVALALIPLMIFSILLSTYYFGEAKYVSLLLAHYSIFHFMKQQTAWFFISAARTGRSKRERIIDKFAIYSCIAGPALLSMMDGIGKRGWRTEVDLMVLPNYLKYPISMIMALSIAAYLLTQINHFIKNKEINWGKHFHLLNGLVIWVIYRLEPFPNAAIFGLLLLVFGHSTPYLFLGKKYVESRKVKGEHFLALLSSPKLMLPVLIVCTMLLSYGEVETRIFFSENIVIRSLLLTVVLTHFTIDSFLWRRDIHPEGLEFLK